jgi:hypothetical protein
VFVAGEFSPDPLFPLEGADVYLVDIQAGGTLSNLSLTSGQAAPPFLEKGTLSIGEAVLDPRGERMLLRIDPDDGDYGLYAVSLVAPFDAGPLMTGLLEEPRMESVGDDMLIFSVPEAPGPAAQIHLLPPVGDPGGLMLLASAPFPVAFDRYTSHRDGLLAAFVGSISPSLTYALEVNTVTRSLHVVWAQARHLAPTLAFSPLGQLIVGFAGPSATTGPYLWASFPQPMQPIVLPIAPSHGFPIEN